MSDGSAISISSVTKRFAATVAVNDLDLEVPRGSLCGFLGPNGAGKSTTIRMIMSIIYPDAGSIDVLGADALSNKDRIGYLPEERGVYRKMKVGEFLSYIGRLKGLSGSGLDERIQGWLERVELPDVGGQKCEELSKGMQQKVQFLASIIHEPELLILDEPFSGLDPVNAELINRLIRELNAAGTTIIFSTHVLHQAERICDRIFLIHKGVKLLDSTLGDIRTRFDPRTIVVEPLPGPVSLDDIAGVHAVHRLGGQDAYELELEDGAEPQRVMKSVVERNPVRSVELRRMTLEEVFVRLVADAEGEGAAASAREALSHA